MRVSLNSLQKTSAFFMVLTLLSGCDSMVDGSNAAASVTGHAFHDAADTWSDVFTYHGKPQPQQPQTRYCYKMMTDIVCYDSLQPTLSAQLIGYQDGKHVSWVQPGGGSLGASGGTPVSYATTESTARPAEVISVQKPIQAEATNYPVTNGVIQSSDLPAPR